MSTTKGDRQAAVFVLLLFLTGVVVRLVAIDGGAPGGIDLRPGQDERALQDSVAAQAERLVEPLKRGERIDVDLAGELDLTRLPRIGPAMAKRIVTDREQNGPFGSLDALQRVSGIGPRLAETLDPHVSFSRSPVAVRQSGARGRRLSLNSASAHELAGLPGIGPSKAEAIIKHRERNGRFSSVDDLTEVPGIGPATLDRIRSQVSVR